MCIPTHWIQEEREDGFVAEKRKLQRDLRKLEGENKAMEEAVKSKDEQLKRMRFSSIALILLRVP